MFSLLRQPFSVYEDTIRETPGRPEMLANYQALWLLPKVRAHGEAGWRSEPLSGTVL
jgi:hypothetical protein